MGLGGRLFLKYQYGPDGPEPPPKDLWSSGWITLALILATLASGGLIWVGIRFHTTTVAMAWVLLSIAVVSGVICLVVKPKLLLELFSRRSLVRSALTDTMLGHQDSLNEILLQILLMTALVGFGVLRWLLTYRN